MERPSGETLFSNAGSISSSQADDQEKRFSLVPKKALAAAGDKRRIAIVSTFTADPLLRALEFWTRTLEISAETVIAPYAQVMQELISSQSLLSQNKSGFNILLIRLEDWIRDRSYETTEKNLEHVIRSASDLISGVEMLRGRTSAAIFVFLCPTSSSLQSMYGQSFSRIERDLQKQFGSIAHVYCWTHDDLYKLYPVVDYEDQRTDRIGHIPYTSEYFVAMATLFARRIAGLLKPQYKVIAVDCDNTLWGGICGEDGAAGIDLKAHHLEFQEMLVRQYEAGMLICLCSKNNQSDVEAVFVGHPEMPLREEHLVCSRVNWKSKSSNLASISQELGLSLDSFIFIDDSPIECAEVKSSCPSVLTLQFPDTPTEVSHLINHVWAFDRIEVTSEAKLRTSQYKENVTRAKALEEAGDMRTFLASLELEVQVSVAQPEQLVRVAELVQRTNQFNLTAVRRSLSEIEALLAAGSIQVLVVHVKDRFGDYGLVGALFLCRRSSEIEVDTFVLSCRVLGREVEHQILRDLAPDARSEGVRHIVLRYRQTPRNAPARMFLERSFAQFRVVTEGEGKSSGESVFTIPVDYLEILRDAGPISESIDESTLLTVSSSTPQELATDAGWGESAFRFSRLPDVLREINRPTLRTRPEAAEPDLPRTPTEIAVAAIVAEVLGLRDVGIRDDFFDLGGDSLMAVQVIARVGSVLGRELPLYQFFEGPTVEKIARGLADALIVDAPIQPAGQTSRIPLSWSQQRLWFIDRMEGSAAYCIPIAVDLRGDLNEAALRTSLDALVQRHDVLRTVFITVDGEPVQRVLSVAHFELCSSDLTGREAKSIAHHVVKQQREELVKPFDLGTGPLIRGRLLKLAENEHVLLITMHHIVSDGWSVGVLIRELGVLYEAHCNGAQNPLPPLPIQYADYAQWQRQWMTPTELEAQLAYWKAHLQGAPEFLDLPTDLPRPDTQSHEGANVCVSIGPDLSEGLRALSRRLNVTLAMTLFAAWSIVLSRLSGQKDIVVGMPVANRPRTELEGLVGFFVNTLAVRVQMEGDPTIKDLLAQVKRSMLGAYARQDVPFEQVVEALKPARTLSRSPIFQVMFALQNAPRPLMRLSGLTLVEHEVPQRTAQFDLSVSLQESADGVVGGINYATDLFSESTIERWGQSFKAVLKSLVEHPELTVSRSLVMSEEERMRVIQLFNKTEAKFPREQLVHQLVEEQAVRKPNAVAVACGTEKLTYGQLNDKANQLAHALRESSVRPDDRVALYVERGLEMVIGLLGILKAGGAYLPLDPNYPAERLSYMLRDSAPVALLTQRRLRKNLPAIGTRVIVLDADESDLGRQSKSNPEPTLVQVHPRNLAYVIYTSGSTGLPKGVAVEHRNVVNLVHWHCAAFNLREGDRCSGLAAIGFDAAVWEIWPTLSVGATLVLASSEVTSDVGALIDWWASQQLDISFLPTPIAEVVISRHISSPTLRTLLVGGDRLRYRPASRSYLLVNNYGPTETTVLATSGSMQDDAVLHIGRPIANTQVYILDDHGQVVPIGVAGEIYIGGAGVARGYLNQPELTLSRFTRNHFSVDPQARIYRTGDLGRWRSDGTIEYLGRNDLQVKIRGFRIELGEIEAQLIGHEGVKDAVVIAREDVPGDKRLVAYVIAEDSSDHATLPSAEALRIHLKAALPDYMVPSAFVMLERMPLTANGKLDRRALPVPELDAYVSKLYESPEGEVEGILAEVWQELLGVHRIGRQDNFFELGGHSLLAMQVVARIHSLLSVEMPIRSLFEFPSLKQLSSRVAELRRASLIEAIEGGGTEIEELLAQMTSMPEGRVQELLRELAMEGRG